MDKTAHIGIAAIILLGGLALPVISACSSQPSPQPPANEEIQVDDSAMEIRNTGYEMISSQEAQKRFSAEEGYVILDVRTAEEFAEGHVANAVNLPLSDISEKESEVLPDKEQEIFVYCRSGNRSKTAAAELVTMGYTHVIEFGGINTWPEALVSE